MKNAVSMPVKSGFSIVLLLLLMVSALVDASPDCSYCAQFEDDVACVRNCLNQFYEGNQREQRTFQDMVDEYSRTGEINSRLYRDENTQNPGFDVEAAQREEVELALDLDTRKSVQLALNKVIPWGTQLKIDGAIGPATREKIKVWESTHLIRVKQGLDSATGYLDEIKLWILFKNANLPADGSAPTKDAKPPVEQLSIEVLVETGCLLEAPGSLIKKLTGVVSGLHQLRRRNTICLEGGISGAHLRHLVMSWQR